MITITIEDDEFNVDQTEWRKTLEEKAEKSKELWDTMTPEERSASLEIVGVSLDMLRESMGQWVPYSFGETIDKMIIVNFSVVSTDVKETMAGLKMKEERDG